MRKLQTLVILVSLSASLSATHSYAEQSAPQYKPSTFSHQSQDISDNAYGASPLAPAALTISEIAPGFALPRFGGGTYHLNDIDSAEGQSVSQASPVVILFYRGHW